MSWHFNWAAGATPKGLIWFNGADMHPILISQAECIKLINDYDHKRGYKSFKINVKLNN